MSSVVIEREDNQAVYCRTNTTVSVAALGYVLLLHLYPYNGPHLYAYIYIHLHLTKSLLHTCLRNHTNSGRGSYVGVCSLMYAVWIGAGWRSYRASTYTPLSSRLMNSLLHHLLLCVCSTLRCISMVSFMTCRKELSSYIH